MKAKSFSVLLATCWLSSCASVENVHVDAPTAPAVDPLLQDPAVQDPDRAAARPFQLTVPQEVDADWIELVSGEWLRGEFEVMRDGTVEFDSDELDMLNLDWDDIIQVRLVGRRSVLLENGEHFTGTLRMRDGVVVVTGDTEQRIERARLMSIVPETEGMSGNWSGKLSLGTTFRRGNTDQIDYSAYAFARRETLATRWDSTYNGAFSRVEGVETTNNHRLRSRFDWFLSNRFYVTPIGIDVFRDPFQNIAYRVTPYVAVGYDIVDTGTVGWSISAGPAYQRTQYISTPAGEEETDDTGAGMFSSRFGWDITPDIEFNVDYDLTVPVPETQGYNHHLAAILAIDLTGDFDLDLSLIWDRVNAPLPDENDVLPEQDDFRLTVGIGYDF